MLTNIVVSALVSCFVHPVCTCVLEPRVPTRAAVEAALNASSAVFEGVVERIDFVATTSVLDSAASARVWRSTDAFATVRVRRHWKGTLGRTVVVRTAAETTMCGASLMEGRAYLIFGQPPIQPDRGAATPVQRGDTVLTSKCTWTTGVGREMRSIIGVLGQLVR